MWRTDHLICTLRRKGEFDMDSLLKIRPTDHGLEIKFSKSIEADQICPVTESVYLDAWSTAAKNGFSEILRVWNYIPNINQFTGGIENYQHFCAGRKNAYSILKLKSACFPAASAVGSRNSDIQFQFLFGKTKPIPITNRLQIEAYDYPSKYGPTPPSFARAAVADSAFFLSGTASIRGHQTMYCGDVTAQLSCTLENIEEVLNETQKKIKKTISKKQMSWRVYLRDPAIKAQIETKLEEKLGPSIEFVSADICRADLLLEIEGMYHGL